MNWNSQVDWKQFTDDVKRRWRELVDEQLDLWSGKRDRSKQAADRQAPQQDVQLPK